eukprot:TRINITY_DN18749_c0_g1_i1.p1 TRINITY_DN18749_c0_g1~~TRINITY_DN18749_c0_g1_i1.p1  ORF type:complete len:317 (+),score=78.83 TRINITY_DN18749_c0_g1_i1:236-1186(+)
MSSSESSTQTVDAGLYYAEYHGHRVTDLSAVHHGLRQAGCNQFVYLMGDSTLDNKHWLFKPHREKHTQLRGAESFVGAAVNGYERVLTPPRMVKDVCYWLNRGASERFGSARLCTMMTSVEESTVADRAAGLLLQDEFIRDHVTERDQLVVSMGGNDVALRPTVKTVLSMLMLTRSPHWLIKSGMAPGFAHFASLFRGRVERLLRLVTARTRPKKIIVCMLYYLDERAGGSWADEVLANLGYDDNPETLQLIIRTLFESIAKAGFDVPGTRVVPMPMYTVLDGKKTGDYCQRVEPSVAGGRKMADALLDLLVDPAP